MTTQGKTQTLGTVNTPNSTNPNPKPYTLEQAAQFLGIKPFHTHQLVLEGKFPNATKVPVPGHVKTLRWEIPLADLQTYATNRKGGVGKRADGRNKFISWFTPQELEAFKAAFPSLPTPVRANPTKATKAD